MNSIVKPNFKIVFLLKKIFMGFVNSAPYLQKNVGHAKILDVATIQIYT